MRRATARPTAARVDVMRDAVRQALHVSPFMGMDHVYDWRLTEPGEHLIVHIESQRATTGSACSTRRCRCAARELTPRARCDRALLRYPFLTARILARIYATPCG